MVQKLLIDLIKHKEFMDLKKSEYDDEFVGNKSLIDECNRIAQSLIDNGADDIDVIRDLQKKNNTDINRKQLLESIRKKTLKIMNQNLHLIDCIHIVSVTLGNYVRNTRFPL